MNDKCSKRVEIPLLPLRDTVVYPNIVVPLFVGREKSIRCLEASMKKDKKIVLVTQKESLNDNPDYKDFFLVGTISSILQMLKLPNGTIKVLVEGLERVYIKAITNSLNYFTAEIKYFENKKLDIIEHEALIRVILNEFEKYLQLNNKIPLEILSSLYNVDNVSRLIDIIASNMQLKLTDRQIILETYDITERLEYLMTIIELELDLLNIEKSIKYRIHQQMEKSQREYYLNEQIKAIQKELGYLDESPDEYEILSYKIASAKMPKEIQKKAEAELQKLKIMPPMSSESTVVRSYLDWILNLPWFAKSIIKKDLIKAQKILDKDHYGLKKVKDRIIEYLAVQNRINKIKGQILCLMGPPGVGKTSLGKSIAKATGRYYIRMALGGIRDEAEIRGHRRTYIGSMPGKIIQKMSQVGVKNPLFLLDEIDKISSDMRGDPASALLEVLDPEQNSSFNDHYLEVDYDLSDVMFIATSNSMNILAPLLDRMEVIRLSGYTENEKINIAQRHILPKQLECNGLRKDEISIDNSALIDIIRYYTRESGVRNLEREIAKLCRKVVKKLLINKNIKNININKNNLSNFLGIHRFDFGKTEKKEIIGQVTGLAWTESGGDLLKIEAIYMPGKGKLTFTGSLGKVMQESIQAALTVVRIRSNKLGINSDFYEKHDIHIHVPEGSTPKDGPSAGIAICTALVSTITGKTVKANIAMTGEITLRGNILAIGGLKEKILSAHRGGIKTILIPFENKRDLEEIPSLIKSELNIHLVKNIEEVLNISL